MNNGIIFIVFTPIYTPFIPNFFLLPTTHTYMHVWKSEDSSWESISPSSWGFQGFNVGPQASIFAH